MKKIFNVLMLLVVLLSPAMNGQAAGLTDKQKTDIINNINAKAASLKTMSCSFVQTKHLSLLSDKMVSDGKMYFKQPDKLRWEYTTPYSYMFIFNNTKVYVGGNKRSSVIDTNTNKMFREVARIMMNTVTGKVLSNASDFVVDVENNGTVWTVVLIPRKKDLKQMFPKIVLTFAKSNYMISEIDMYEKNGDRTNIKLKKIDTDSAVNETLFVIPK